MCCFFRCLDLPFQVVAGLPVKIKIKSRPRGLRLSWPEVNCLVAAFDAAAKTAKRGHVLNPFAQSLRDRAVKRKEANSRLIDRLEPVV